MALPLLPGLVFDKKLGKEKFNKSQCFEYRNDVPVHVGETKCGVGGDPMPGAKKGPRHSFYPKGKGSQLPAWVAFDRQVLCFDAYFQEAVNEKREEKYRIRKCKIYFYLEDDTVQVIEKKVENSGIPQGTLIRRHHIPLPPPHDDQFYTVEHFNVGKELKMYSRVFHMTGCDTFTNNFLRKLGVQVEKPVTIPGDPYTKHRQIEQDSMQPLRPYEKEDNLRQFLENDRRVLRFYCHWDDTDSMFGDSRNCVLHYFLADDTIEIREIIPANSGRDAIPLFLRRAKLSKEPNEMNQPGEITKRTILNVFGPTGHGGRYILDSLKTGALHTEYYHDSDLMVGAAINVWGRRFLICGCDEFTQEYYKSKYGIENFEPIKYKTSEVLKTKRDLPPYNGFGSEEDSMRNCISLIPIPPKRDFIKFMEKDRHGLDSNVLRFVAKLDSDRPIEVERRFIISYFLSDDTVLVFEPPQRNSGIIGGKFLERGRLKISDGSRYYTAQDLFIGSCVEFCKHAFILVDADEYAVSYMESHSDEFPQANSQIIIPKMRRIMLEYAGEIGLMFASVDRKKTGKMTFESFRDIIKQIARDEVSVHEILTLVRYYGKTTSNDNNFETLVASVQQQLRKVNYENFVLMKDSCVYADQTSSGFIPATEMRMIVKSFKLPIQEYLLQALLDSTTSDGEGNIDYTQFIQFLNWRDHSVISQKYLPSLAFGVDGIQRTGPFESLNEIPYEHILDTLTK